MLINSLLLMSMVVTAPPYLLQKYAEDWWQWIISIPMQNNPQVDRTGELTMKANQHNEVFFIAGAYNQTQPTVRNITLEEGQAVFFPVIVGGYAYVEPWYSLLTETIDTVRGVTLYDKLLAANHIHLIDPTVDLHATLDGKQLPWHRITTSVYNVVYPEGNPYNITKGSRATVVDGYWVYLDSIPLGQHVLIFGGHSPPDYFTTLIYHVNVVKEVIQ